MRQGVELLWIPLGAGSRLPVVRASGWLYETLAAARDRRPRRSIFHAALRVWLEDTWYAIEMAPAWGAGAHGPAVVVGPVGLRALGRYRAFRYQVRCRERGTIPDASSAVGGPVWLSDRPEAARRLLDAVPDTPALTWGRDDLRTGAMWNSNSLIAWLITRAGLDAATVHPPQDGRAPGWRSGVVAAQANASTGGHEQTR